MFTKIAISLCLDSAEQKFDGVPILFSTTMYTVHELLAIFWNAKFWLPPGMTWEDYEPKDEYDHTNYRHLYLYPIPLTAGILIFRFALEKYVGSRVKSIEFCEFCLTCIDLIGIVSVVSASSSA